jgi:hypothetical protein
VYIGFPDYTAIADGPQWDVFDGHLTIWVGDETGGVGSWQITLTEIRAVLPSFATYVASSVYPASPYIQRNPGVYTPQ